MRRVRIIGACVVVGLLGCGTTQPKPQHPWVAPVRPSIRVIAVLPASEMGSLPTAMRGRLLDDLDDYLPAPGGTAWLQDTMVPFRVELDGDAIVVETSERRLRVDPTTGEVTSATARPQPGTSGDAAGIVFAFDGPHDVRMTNRSHPRFGISRGDATRQAFVAIDRPDGSLFATARPGEPSSPTWSRDGRTLFVEHWRTRLWGLTTVARACSERIDTTTGVITPLRCGVTLEPIELRVAPDETRAVAVTPRREQAGVADVTLFDLTDGHTIAAVSGVWTWWYDADRAIGVLDERDRLLAPMGASLLVVDVRRGIEQRIDLGPGLVMPIASVRSRLPGGEWLTLRARADRRVELIAIDVDAALANAPLVPAPDLSGPVDPQAPRARDAAPAATLRCPDGSAPTRTAELVGVEYACRASDEVVDGPYALDTADGAPLIRGWWRASMPVGTWTYWRPDGTPLLARTMEPMDERRWYPTGVLAAHFAASVDENYFPSGRLSQRREPGARVTYRPDGRELIRVEGARTTFHRDDGRIQIQLQDAAAHTTTVRTYRDGQLDGPTLDRGPGGITTGCYIGGQATNRPCPDGASLWRWPTAP